MSSLIELTPCGIYVPRADIYVDPWCGVPRAVITHAHADHARWGAEKYLTAAPGTGLLRQRVSSEALIEGLAYGERLLLNGLELSLHPAGHILGSAQVRLEYGGEVCVISGDYKRHEDPTCAPFEPLRCNTFVTESTFGLPIYRWPAPGAVMSQINDWWAESAREGKRVVLYAYSLGKAQRVLAGLDASIGPIIVHGAVARFLDDYRAAGVNLPAAIHLTQEIQNAGGVPEGAAVIAPPSAAQSPWLKKFQPYRAAFVSGWMLVRGARRFRNVERGFVLSDHCDWPTLLQTVQETGADSVAVTHGYSAALSRYLQEQGLNSWVIPTRFEGEQEDEPEKVEG